MVGRQEANEAFSEGDGDTLNDGSYDCDDEWSEEVNAWGFDFAVGHCV
ncbi:MAG: hypothetical protein PHE72_14625 [candidate division Zixibacteria bacterium]|nr:hypothetical protein [candidate division Zixibacteria bacterium]